MVEIIKNDNNIADHIVHRIGLSLLTAIQLMGSTNVDLIAEAELIDELATNLTVNIVLIIYAFVISVKSNENRFWLLAIIALLMTSTGLYLDVVIDMRGTDLE